MWKYNTIKSIFIVESAYIKAFEALMNSVVVTSSLIFSQLKQLVRYYRAILIRKPNLPGSTMPCHSLHVLSLLVSLLPSFPYTCLLLFMSVYLHHHTFYLVICSSYQGLYVFFFFSFKGFLFICFWWFLILSLWFYSLAII